jgi:NAD(P)-dependent dehydrogenase (short-subunit alcohol dehydrogenase family)
VEKSRRRALVLAGDLSGPQACRDLIDATVREFGRVDIAVSNAACQMTHTSIHEISDEESEYTIAMI